MPTTPGLCFSFDELTRVVNGSWAVPPVPGSAGVTGVADDSRRVGEGNLFVAIRGELADGHEYLHQALAAGAAALCVEREIPAELLSVLWTRGVACLRTGNSLAAFQLLAHAHRLRFDQAR